MNLIFVFSYHPTQDKNPSVIHPPPCFSFHQYMQTWRPIQERSWCYYTVQIKQTPESLVLSIPHAGSFYEGPYRCVSNAENVTEPERSSEVLAFKVHCECLGW